jgi:hypothetical protein
MQAQKAKSVAPAQQSFTFVRNVLQVSFSVIFYLRSTLPTRSSLLLANENPKIAPLFYFYFLNF